MGGYICCTQQDLQLGLGGFVRKWDRATQHFVCWLRCSEKIKYYSPDWCFFPQTYIMLKPSFGSSLCLDLKGSFG